jgi:hypothetical protein
VQFWIPSRGSDTLFDLENIDEDVEDFVSENWWSDCEWEELPSYAKMRVGGQTDVIQWLGRQEFSKVVSWKFVLGPAEARYTS